MSTQSPPQQNQNIYDGPVAIFYDIETCPVPNCQEVDNNIRRTLRARQINGDIDMFIAYGDFSRFSLRTRLGLSRTRVMRSDVPKEINFIDSILCDMICFACDNPPPACIMLISLNDKFSDALHRLSMRGYATILAIPSGAGVSSPLRDASRFVCDWPSLSEASSSFNYQITNTNMLTQPSLQQNRNINGRSVTVLWDIESCPVPSNISTEDAAANIRKALQDHPQIDGSVSIFSAYGNFQRFSECIIQGLRRANVECRDVPKGINPFDTILVDMLFFSLDNPRPACIMLISGDENFCQALNTLDMLEHTVILAIPSEAGVSSDFTDAGTLVWDWPSLSETSRSS